MLRIIFQTHFLVVDQDQDVNDSYKGRNAQKLAIPIVSTIFIQSCIENNKVLNYQDFTVTDKPSSELFAKGKIIGKIITS